MHKDDGSTKGEEVLAMLVRDSTVDRLRACAARKQRCAASSSGTARLCDANESSVSRTE